MRAAPHLLAQNEKGQSGLWAFGISGDFPILLVRVRDGESLLLRETLLAFIYWRSHHVTVNLVILNDQDTGYALDLHNSIQNQIRRMGAEASLNQRDGIFVLRTDQLQTTDKILFETVAGVILDEKDGTLAEHADRLIAQHTHLPQFTASLSPKLDPEPTPQLQLPGDLLFDNGLWRIQSRWQRVYYPFKARVNTRRTRGSTSSPIRSLDFWFPNQVQAVPGQRTAARTV